MKQQVARLSPHQNGKVFGVLTALGSLVVIVPMFLIMSAVAPMTGQNALPAFVFLLFPVVYLVFGYVSVAIGCLVYNGMFRFLGGIEYETKDTIVVATDIQT